VNEACSSSAYITQRLNSVFVVALLLVLFVESLRQNTRNLPVELLAQVCLQVWVQQICSLSCLPNGNWNQFVVRAAAFSSAVLGKLPQNLLKNDLHGWLNQENCQQIFPILFSPNLTYSCTTSTRRAFPDFPRCEALTSPPTRNQGLVHLKNIVFAKSTT